LGGETWCDGSHFSEAENLPRDLIFLVEISAGGSAAVVEAAK